MKIVKPSYAILDRNGLTVAQKIEMAGRTAYKSEEKITDDSAYPFMDKMLKNRHLPVIEFANIHIAIECAMPIEEFNEKMRDFVMDGERLKYHAISSHSSEDGNYHLLIISGTVRAFLEMICNSFHVSEPESLMHSVAYVLHNAGPHFPIDLGDNACKDKIQQDERISCGVLSTNDLMHLMKDAPDIAEGHLMCAVRFICNRAVSHELIRHRPLSVIQESQRYCRYSLDKFGNEVTFIKPSAFFPCPDDFPNDPKFDDKYTEYFLWENACKVSEETYFYLLSLGASPQAARTVLVNSCKTELILYATIREWRHIFSMRVPPEAEPSMRELMIPLESEFFSEENKLKWE